MLQSPSAQRFQLLSTLTHIREEWQEAAGNSSLIEVEGNMGHAARRPEQRDWSENR